ncbi:MAG: enoyl-CoA hydratase-related protein [Gammaproteobacteria bacterium]
MKSPAAALTLENVLYEKRDGIAYVTLNRPKVMNALSAGAWSDLRTAFEDARDDVFVRGAILTGAGPKAFIAGEDIGELARVGAVEAEQSTRSGQAVLDLIENLGKPVIAAVNGFALGGGCETAMACTFRIAAESARFGQPEVKLGVLPGAGGTQRLPRLVGKGRALQLILSGEMIGAQEAFRIGLVNEVVPAADLIPRCESILKQIFANAPLAIRFSLEAVNKGMETSQSAGLMLEASLFAICAASEDKKEGTSAFLAKRPPEFKGR